MTTALPYSYPTLNVSSIGALVDGVSQMFRMIALVVNQMYSVQPTYAFVDTTGGPQVYHLPATPTLNQSVTVKDVKGHAGVNNITVSGSANIDGAATYVINQPYGANGFVWNGSTWSVV
jgi:hypothetical protein